MSAENDLALAYLMGYDDALAKRKPDASKARVLGPYDLAVENARLQEQMERLVTLLRNDCDIEASWDGLRRFWSIGLTEGGCLMRDRACKAEAENSKLREELEVVGTAAYLYGRDDLKAENARLRRGTTTRHAKYKTKYGRKVPLCECCSYSIGDMRWHFCPNCGAEVVDE